MDQFEEFFYDTLESVVSPEEIRVHQQEFLKVPEIKMYVYIQFVT